MIKRWVDSTFKYTTEGFLDDLVGCSIAEAFTRPMIQRVNNEGKRMIDPRETDDARSAGRCEREVADVGFPFGFLPGKRSEPRSRSEVRHVRGRF